MKFKKYFTLLFLLLSLIVNGQTQLSLADAIRIATDSSLAAFKAQNLFLSCYWEYRTYIAQKKPSLTINTTLIDYNRALTKRYNSTQDIDEYREQQNIYSNANVSLSQNFFPTGGTLYFDTELSRIQDFGESSYTQFSTVPFRIGFVQPIFGFNKFKWQIKIEPLKYEKAKKDYLQAVETISVQIVDYFFDLLVAQMKVNTTAMNVANADTLYGIGQKRLEIASLSQAEVLTLKVDVLNAKNKLAEAKKQFKNAQFSFNSFLRLNEDSLTDLQIPEHLPFFLVSYEKVLAEAQTNNPDLLGYKQQLFESARDMEQARRESLLDASLTTSFGFNQQNEFFHKAYQNPLDQQTVTVGLSVPIIDWGQRRGKYNMAKKNYEVTNLTVEQANIDFRKKIMMAVYNFNIQQDIVASALETSNVAKQAYETTKQRFVIGKSDVNSLGLALDRYDQSNIDYLEALRFFWKYYFTLRQLTLYDFENNKSISQNFDELLELN